ncbi:putative cellobiose dehydrogenase protein [Botrytis cinerea BcDW1]|uniref:Putative cellobiose dehydrogenase protein n=1 Tax=Botryotinia fuckeliana (strain BcDW1) TaxID=1290391 RepID=M7UYV4_BOTF1|nr:putative cellobiose dehydrogenase protein [Botrytis cinerea BcDW1]
MRLTGLLYGIIALASYAVREVSTQDFAAHGYYTEPNTGITFYTSTEVNGTIVGDGEFSLVSLGGYTFGMALPPSALTTDSYDYIGLIIGSLPNGTGWSGVVHGQQLSAAMPGHLLLIAWPYNGQIITSFRYGSYATPVLYGGSASVTQLYSSINSTHWVLVYKCTNCFKFDDPTQTAYNVSTSAGGFEYGWAQNIGAPDNPSDPANAVLYPAEHNNGMGEFSIKVASATQSSYSKWASMTATITATTGTATATATYSTSPIPTSTSYDYIVVGGGAGGVPMADKLAQSGKSVLLIEKGVASSARWGGTIRPESGWLAGSNLTWFDVPGECNRIWHGGSVGVACDDIDQMAGCVLGGGTAVNAGLWWNPDPSDWDYNFPPGWQAKDVAAATSRVFSTIPGTDHPSMDGKLYLQSGYNIVAGGLKNAGWTNVTANSVPAQKNRTFAYTPYMYINGERGGPLATYLVDANKRSNFHMWLNTSVKRIIRDGGHATGIEVEATNNGGRQGVVSLTSVTGRVIVSAGAFGTPKLLFRSGIGPTDQLNVVLTSTDGPTMINSSYWYNLPVGYNLDDHLNTDVQISHPNISYYDWVEAWNTPISADATSYLTKRTGPLAQAAPDIGPMFWEQITPGDGIPRAIQWTARVEGDVSTAMTLSSYLGRGQVGPRGRTTISKGLTMSVSTMPWGNTYDLAAVATAIDHLVTALSTVKNLTFIYPKPGMTGTQYVASVPLTYANIGARRANHWLGTAKLGTDSGLAGGTSVVDLNALVYGTDNIHVVDASIFPGMPSTNPSSLIVIAAEHASQKILALPALKALPRYAQCGGLSFNYTTGGSCAAPYKCTVGNSYYWQCL